jgi:hypothetical protein
MAWVNDVSARGSISVIARCVQLSRLPESVQRMANTRGDSDRGAPKKCPGSPASEPGFLLFYRPFCSAPWHGSKRCEQKRNGVCQGFSHGNQDRLSYSEDDSVADDTDGRCAWIKANRSLSGSGNCLRRISGNVVCARAMASRPAVVRTMRG